MMDTRRDETAPLSSARRQLESALSETPAYLLVQAADLAVTGVTVRSDRLFRLYAFSTAPSTGLQGTERFLKDAWRQLNYSQ